MGDRKRKAAGVENPVPCIRVSTINVCKGEMRSMVE